MNQQLLIEIAWTVGQFFLHPILYVAIVAAVLTGYFRVKRERRDFKTRLTWGWAELNLLVKDVWPLSLIASLVLAVLGLIFYPEFLVILSLVILISLFTFQFKILSAAYVFPIAAALWSVLHFASYSITLGPIRLAATDFSWTVLWPIAFLAGLLIVMEGMLVRKQGASIVSPQVTLTKRGGNAVEYKAKRIWLVPVVLLIPGDWFTQFATYWPVVHFGEQSFAVAALPLVTGFQQTYKKSYFFEAIPGYSKQILILGSVATLLSCLAILTPWFGALSLALAFTAKLYIDIKTYIEQNKGGFAVAPVKEGLQIAGVLKDSPAEKMGLQIGERIVKVNGQRVTSEQDLYEAIQINAAHCRLEIVDHNNELRLKQHVIFRHDHHRLGLMLAVPHQ